MIPTLMLAPDQHPFWGMAPETGCMMKEDSVIVHPWMTAASQWFDSYW